MSYPRKVHELSKNRYLSEMKILQNPDYNKGSIGVQRGRDITTYHGRTLQDKFNFFGTQVGQI